MEEDKVSKLESTIVSQVARDAALRDLQAVIDAEKVQKGIEERMNQRQLEEK